MAKLQVRAMYRFVTVSDPRSLCIRLRSWCEGKGISGTVLLAEEGLNGTLAGTAESLEEVIRRLRDVPGFDDLQTKISWASSPPFDHLNIRCKREIVTMGLPGIDPRRETGRRVDPEAWNELLLDPEVLVIDSRNDYETSIGTFQGAVDPRIGSFREMPGWLERSLDPAQRPRVAMYCTGGIRCEKSTAHLLSLGFEEVYQLDGGILRYLESVPEEQSLWQGECFVFDRRIALGPGLCQGTQAMCVGCGWPVAALEYEPGPGGIHRGCPRCFPTESCFDSLESGLSEEETRAALRREALDFPAPASDS